MKLPDGPQTPPFLQMIQFITRPLEFLDACAQRYGDPFTVRLGHFPPFVFFSNPQAIQEIFTANPKMFDTGRANDIFRPWSGDNSVLLLDGESHQRQRQLLMPPFHGERMRACGTLICEIAQQVMGQWRIGQPFSVISSMQEISLLTILNVVFGLHEGQRFQQLKELLLSLLALTGSTKSSSLVFFKTLQQDLGPWSPWGRFLRQKQQIDELIYAEIRQRREQSDFSRADILTFLMSARDADGQPMTDVELRDELMTLLIGGYDNISLALTWALYSIHRYPEVMDRLLKELDTLSCDSDPSAIAQLPYLSAVCSETLRVNPIIMFTAPRIVKAPLQLMGYEFQAETVLIPCIYLTHYREDLYPNARHFKPERFLERRFSASEFFPFGGGNRRCIGMAFSLFEMKLVLATILSRLQLALVDNRPVRPVRRGLNLAPAGGVRMAVTGLRQDC